MLLIWCCPVAKEMFSCAEYNFFGCTFIATGVKGYKMNYLAVEKREVYCPKVPFVSVGRF